MRVVLASNIMPRTTVDIDGPILADLKALQKREGKTLGRMISELLATALAERKRVDQPVASFCWNATAMRARVNISDKEAVWRVLDEDEHD